jgi:hypothetical protein
VVHRLTPDERLRQAQAERVRLHRLSPSRPLRDADDAAAFVRERRIVTETGHAGVPVLAHAVAGRELVGSWMASPEVHRIYDLLSELSNHDLCSAALLDGKVTIFEPSLAPAVNRLATDPERRARLIAELPPAARRLLDRVECDGDVRMDQTGPVEAAMDVLLEAALNAAVAVPEREARKWFEFAAERLDQLAEAGRVERIAIAPRQPWLLPAS